MSRPLMTTLTGGLLIILGVIAYSQWWSWYTQVSQPMIETPIVKPRLRPSVISSPSTPLPPRTAVALTDAGRKLVQVGPQETPAESIISVVGDNTYRVDRARLIHAIHGDTRVLWAQARVSPRIERFQLKGFQLSDIQDESLIQQAGLKADDIVTTVNGTTLESVPAALKAYQSVRHAQEIAVEVERHGGRRTLRYVIH